MSEKRFERWNDNSCKVKDNQEGILLNWEDVINKLNEQQDIIGEQKIAIDELTTDHKKLEKENEQLKEENEQLRKQIQNYEQLISNSMSKKQCCNCEHFGLSKDPIFRNEKEEIIKEQERRIIVLENLLTNIGVKWVDDDE